MRAVDDAARGVPPSSPHEQYAQSFRQAGLDRTALGRDWLAAAERALQTPLSVTLPYRETGYFAPEEPGAVAYRFDARRGQRLRIEVELETSEAGRLFRRSVSTRTRLGPPEHVTSAPAGRAGWSSRSPTTGRTWSAFSRSSCGAGGMR